MIGRNGERGSGISALAARHDDDDDDDIYKLLVHINLYKYWETYASKQLAINGEKNKF